LAKSDDIIVGTFRYFEPSVVYYSGKNVRILQSPREVADFISSHPRAFVITEGDRFTNNDLNNVLIGGVLERSRHKRFLYGRDLILIGRR